MCQNWRHDKLLPKDGTSWLVQGPNYTQDVQSHIHTQWPPDERSSWQYAAEYWDIQTSTRTQLHNKIHNHTHTQWATWRRWDILTGCCQRMGHPDYHNYPITHKIHNRTQLPPDERWDVWQAACCTLISHKPRASLVVQDYAPDFVHNYACAVLNDGMLMLEFRDAIYEGDGNCILRVCKFLLLQFRYAGRKKHALEAFHKLAAHSSRKTYKNILSQHNVSQLDPVHQLDCRSQVSGQHSK